MGLAELKTAFPDRPLTLRAPIRTWTNWFFGLILLAMPIGLGWWGSQAIVPTLLTDMELRAGAVPVQGQVRGSCRSKYGLLQTCDMVVTAGRTKDGGSFEQSLEYIFVDPHIVSYTVQVMADPTRPGVLTTDMGLNNITSRAVTFGVMALLALGAGIGGINLMLTGGKAKRRLREMSGKRLTPVPSFVGRDREGWVVTPVDGGATSRWQLPKKAEPFWLDPQHGIALGVSVPGAAVFPLDKDLSWADLNDQERARLRAVAAPAG
ncbi:hypothetical protein [Muricoccus radiodurans]|uniref:hypothetical protein n=1 Tax=Muricoccus radiodurans TaxID=2231721 RepID=UPI003CF4B743